MALGSLGHAASVVALVEALQHGGVGPLKHPLLAGGGRIARVHEHPALFGTAVDAAVADRVVHTLVLQKTRDGRGRTGVRFCNAVMETRVCAGSAYLPVAPELVALHAVAVVQSDRAVVGDGVKADFLGVHGVARPDVFSPAEGEDLMGGTETSPAGTSQALLPAATVTLPQLTWPWFQPTSPRPFRQPSIQTGLPDAKCLVSKHMPLPTLRIYEVRFLKFVTRAF